jgi:NRAMP (natural resistance-associated macrophage protein)-like metal ion transporter
MSPDGAEERAAPQAAAPAAPPAGTGAREFAIRRQRHPVLRVLQVLGPGLVAGASDDDPSGVATYAIAGASMGFATLWTALITVPMMAWAQFVAAKIGLVTGRGLTGVLRRHYPPAVLYGVAGGIAITNTINAGVDIGAIAAAINVLVPVPILGLIVPVAAVILGLQLWGSYRAVARVFKALTLVFVAYLGAGVLARPDAAAVLRGTFLPSIRLDAASVATLVALFGTSMSPYMWFWQAATEVEERVALGQRRLWQRRGASDRELRYAAWDVTLGMVFSNVIAYFIILATGATLFKAGHTHIETAAQAAQALRPLAGQAARLLFAVGLLASGCLAVPVLTSSAGYVVAEALGRRSSLDAPPGRARTFYGVIAASVLVGMLVNFAGINPIRALFLTAVLNGFLTPPLLLVLVLAGGSRRIMGERRNGLWLTLAGWATVLVNTAVVAALVLTWGKG